MLKNILFAGTASVLMIGTAQAADIIEPAAYDWTGPYVGLQAGYAWGENDISIDPAEETTTPPPEVLLLSADSDPVILDPLDGGSIGIDGFVGGLHAGYNFQMNSLVLGLEGDIEYADLQGDTDIQETSDSPSIGKARQDIDWLASLRLRAGFAMDRALIYATGGLAVGGVEFSASVPEEVDESNKDTSWGWTVGGGLEYAFTDDLSGRIEYRYTELDDVEISNDLGDAEIETNIHAVRAGLSWHFNSM
jgi:outer membrane immunogenic protein